MSVEGRSSDDLRAEAIREMTRYAAALAELDAARRLLVTSPGLDELAGLRAKAEQLAATLERLEHALRALQ